MGVGDINTVQLDVVGLVLTFWAAGLLLGSGWIARLELAFQERMTGMKPSEENFEVQARYLEKLGKVVLPIALAVFALGTGLRFLH
jgi:hypothetical protein